MGAGPRRAPILRQESLTSFDGLNRACFTAHVEYRDYRTYFANHCNGTLEETTRAVAGLSLGLKNRQGEPVAEGKTWPTAARRIRTVLRAMLVR